MTPSPTLGAMTGRRFSTAVLVALALSAAAAVASGHAPEAWGGAEARTDDAVAVAVRAQPALVPGTQRPVQQVALLAVLAGLVGVAAAGCRLVCQPRWGVAPRTPGRPAVHPRGPPFLAS